MHDMRVNAVPSGCPFRFRGEEWDLERVVCMYAKRRADYLSLLRFCAIVVLVCIALLL